MSARSDMLALSAQYADLQPGWMEEIPVTTPAAGVLAVGRTVPGDTWEMILTATATFTADGTVGTRQPRLEVVDVNGNALYWAHLSTGVVASTNVQACLAINGQDDRSASARSQTMWPALLLQSGFKYQFNVNSIGAADAWSGITFYVMRYSTEAVRAALS